MKKMLLALVLGLCLVGPASALYITANTCNTQWAGTTTLTGTSSSTSDFVQTAGCQYILYTKTSGSVTAEASWYYSTGTTVFSTEAIYSGTPLTVKSTRVKFKLYSTATATPCAFFYGY